MLMARAAAWAVWAAWTCNSGQLAIRQTGERPGPDSAGQRAESPAQAGLSVLGIRREGSGVRGRRRTMLAGVQGGRRSKERFEDKSITTWEDLHHGFQSLYRTASAS